MDRTENVRRSMVQLINKEPMSRKVLEEHYGEVWDTKELTHEFEVMGFMAPYVSVRRRRDDAKGTLLFQHTPRFFFRFELAGVPSFE